MTDLCENEGAAFLRDLGDGLILRRSIPEDEEGLSIFTDAIFPPGVGPWVHDFMNGAHPGFSPRDFTIVEEAKTGKIVSSLCLIPQKLSYGGTEILAGQVESVATSPEYRRKGLIRAQMETVHRWSEARGEVCQIILGIPNFYRRFGYEMALDAECGRTVRATDLPVSPEDGVFRVRPASAEDAPFIASLYEAAMRRYEISAVVSPELWRYRIFGRDDANDDRFDYHLIESERGDPTGAMAISPRLKDQALEIHFFEIAKGKSWHRASLAAFRELKAVGERLQAESGVAFREIRFKLGSESPLYRAFPQSLKVESERYAHYLRVSDLSRFLLSVAPVLERRLESSPLAGHDGNLDISFYGDGVRLTFEKGRMTRAESRTPLSDESGVSRFPGLSFLHPVFGSRSIEETARAFPDCRIRDELAYALLDTLFPKRASQVWLPI